MGVRALYAFTISVLLPHQEFSNLVLSVEWNLQRAVYGVVTLRLYEIGESQMLIITIRLYFQLMQTASTLITGVYKHKGVELGSFTWFLEAGNNPIGWQPVERMQQSHWFSSLDLAPAYGPDPRVSRRSSKSGEETNLYFDVDKRWCLYNISKSVNGCLTW
ncbi:hypothetical protein DFS33DRAFT_1273599 [Desarmillaria ectypa]|nr:hypothetical protein DFS33DRAFT_1273599 [Desarmillaria ectypa]